jgi:hypothetical protein
MIKKILSTIDLTIINIANNFTRSLLPSDMRKGVAVGPLAAEILMGCRNFMFAAALTFSIIHFLNLKYFGTFSYKAQIVHSSTNLNPLKDAIRDKPLLILGI